MSDGSLHTTKKLVEVRERERESGTDEAVVETSESLCARVGKNQKSLQRRHRRDATRCVGAAVAAAEEASGATEERRELAPEQEEYPPHLCGKEKAL